MRLNHVTAWRQQEEPGAPRATTCVFCVRRAREQTEFARPPGCAPSHGHFPSRQANSALTGGRHEVRLFLLAGEQDEITTPEQVYRAAGLLGTPPGRLSSRSLCRVGIGLFMGTQTPRIVWPDWIPKNP